ncbi:hypothetical protein GCM10010363_71910 [Streptomyces omiyaensis]|nr:hypothetical protein GCM10010363_71910 [Streptomyces omiyaensis]
MHPPRGRAPRAGLLETGPGDVDAGPSARITPGIQPLPGVRAVPLTGRGFRTGAGWHRRGPRAVRHGRRASFPAGFDGRAPPDTATGTE